MSVSLAKLTKKVREVLYADNRSSGESLSWSSVAAVLSSLREWQASLPPWLKHNEFTAPTYERAVGILFARYSSVFMLATRPFLLAAVLYRDAPMSQSKRKLYDALCRMCVDAAERSLRNWESMNRSKLITGLVITDFNCILEIAQVFAIAFQSSKKTQYIACLKRCAAVLEGLPSIGWCKRAVPELMNQLEQVGAPKSEEVVHAPLDPALEMLPSGSEAYGDPMDRYVWTLSPPPPPHLIPDIELFRSVGRCISSNSPEKIRSAMVNHIDWNGPDFGEPLAFGMDMDESCISAELMQQASSLSALQPVFDGQEYTDGTEAYSLLPAVFTSDNV